MVAKKDVLNPAFLVLWLEKLPISIVLQPLPALDLWQNEWFRLLKVITIKGFGENRFQYEFAKAQPSLMARLPYYLLHTQYI